MFTQQSYILKNVIIERERLMAVPARLLVRKGQTVRAGDPVAEDVVYPEHVLIDATRGLGIPEARLESLLQCKPGMKVQSGDLLAGPVGFPKRVIRAPKNGKVLYTGKGQILMGLEGASQKLLAGYPGEVVELIPDRGVRIRTYGDLLQGVWGNGAIGEGVIEPIHSAENAKINHRDLNPSFLGKIIVSGYSNDPSLFERAVEMGLKGLIFASLDPLVVKQAKAAPIPILVIEGFGEKSMNEGAQHILQSAQGKLASINAEYYDLCSSARPEVVIPTTVDDCMTLPEVDLLLEPGKIIRVVSLTKQNYFGVLEDFVGKVKFPNGFFAEAARVKIGDESMIVPLLNIELLETFESCDD